MTPTLLTLLTGDDIRWMVTAGQWQDLPPQSILIDPQQPPDHLILLLEGMIGVEMSSPSISDQPIVLHRSPGTLLGSLPTLTEWTLPAIARTLTPTQLLSIPVAPLEQKIHNDPAFAARLYRAIAQSVFQNLCELAQCATTLNAVLYPFQIRDASTVFAELQDHDLDWFIAVGQVQSLKPNDRLMQYAAPIDALHWVLDGVMALSIPTRQRSLLGHAFSPSRDDDGVEMARRSRGDVLGEFLLLPNSVSMFTVEARRDTQILSIPQWRLATKLLYDPDFAARLYRMLVILLINKQIEMVKHLGFLTSTPEINHTTLNQLAIAEARFEWMFCRIQYQSTQGHW